MSSFTSKLTALRESLSKEHPSQIVDRSIDWFTFLVGLLPDELVVGKLAQIVNKMITERALSSKFDHLQKEVASVNERIDKLESGIIRIEEIGKTIAHNSKSQNLLSEFLEELKKDLGKHPSEFNLITSNWSTQEIVNSVVTADWINISATGGSTNSISGTRIEAEKTNLVATDFSKNQISNSHFVGKSGVVGMIGDHSQSGFVSITGSSIGYGQNSSTQMGDWVMGTKANGDFFIGVKPEYVTGKCPTCSKQIQFEKSSIVGLTHLKCTSCGSVHQI